jgi:hypothetical protein
MYCTMCVLSQSAVFWLGQVDIRIVWLLSVPILNSITQLILKSTLNDE